MRRLDTAPRQLIELGARPTIGPPQFGPQIADESGQLLRLRLLHGDLLEVANEARERKGLTNAFSEPRFSGTAKERTKRRSAQATNPGHIQETREIQGT